MNEAVSAMLAKYECKSIDDYENALKEIFQEIALLGLWRSKFFERGAFYGGTALRILYGLNRFSEDLDFSLLASDPSFRIIPYCDSIISELESFGFNVDISSKQKTSDSTIESAFIKTGTLQNLLSIEAPSKLARRIPINQLIKVKLEIDIDPPGGFETEAKYLLQPIPFSINTYTLPNLFAGKLHVVLCRKWKTRVKGRDWYDFVWFVGREVPVRLAHLQARMVQSGDLDPKEILDGKKLKKLIRRKIEELDIAAAKEDVQNTLKDPSSIDVWSDSFFLDILSKMKIG